MVTWELTCASCGSRLDVDEDVERAEAQAVLRADPRDPNKLDGGARNGIACESNPPPKDLVPVVIQ